MPREHSLRFLPMLTVLSLVVAGCSTDPTTSEEYQDLEQELAGVEQEFVAMEQQLAEVAAQRDSLAESEVSDGTGESISEMVMTAWATGDQAAIDAIYAEDVRMVLDGDSVAENREQITEIINGAISVGNTYQQVGPVAEYVDPSEDLYIATLVEVTGIGHPNGDAVVGFYRVRDGKVDRHVFMEAKTY